MNPITSITTAPETAGAKTQAGKLSKDAGAGFQNMLESALNTPEARRDAQQSKKGDAKTSKLSETNEESGVSPETAENEDEAIHAAIASAMTATASVSFGQQIEALDGHASPEITAVSPIGDTQAQAPPETSAAQAEPKAPESGGQTVQSETGNQSQSHQIHQSHQSQKEQHAVQDGTANRSTDAQNQRNSEDAPAAAIHRELQVEDHSYRISRAPAGEEDSKLGDMLQKAAQELGQNKPVTIEAQKPPEEAAIEEPKTADASTKPVDTEQKVSDDADGPASNNQQANAIKPEQNTIKTSEKLDDIPPAQVAHEPEATVRETEKPDDAKPQPVRAPDQVEQIRAQVTRNIEQERMEFRMQLNPQELGRINVKMILEGGKLAVQITAFNPKAADMLTRQADGLIAALKTGNMEVSTVNIVTAGENVSADMSSEYNLANPQQGSRDPDGPKGAGRSGEAKGETESSAGVEDEIKPQELLNYLI